MITNQYAYNGDGQRVQVIDSQGTKKPIWDGENILLETDGADAAQVVYTLEPAGYGNLVSQRRSSTTSYFLFDALGSTRKLTGSAGSVTGSYDYRAYGETFTSGGTTVNVFRWVGEKGYYFDVDRAAYSIRARHYSPKTARWISQDPIGFEGSEWNLYEYVQSNPLSHADPTGEYWSWNPINWFRCRPSTKPSPFTPKDIFDRKCINHCNTLEDPAAVASCTLICIAIQGLRDELDEKPCDILSSYCKKLPSPAAIDACFVLYVQICSGVMD